MKVLLKLVCYTCGVTISETRYSTLHCVASPMVIAVNCSWSFMYCVIILCVSLLPHVYRFTVCIAVLNTLAAGLLARSQYPEGPATSHLGTGFSWFPCVYKQMLS